MAVAYSVSSVTVKDGALDAEFVVKRSGTASDLSVATSVDYDTADVTAVAGTDYTATSGSLAFDAGATENTVSVAIIEDAYNNSATTTFLFNLTNFGSATCSISPSTTTSKVQSYLYIPEDDDPVLVPTSTSHIDNLKNQAVYDGFIGPSAGTQVEMPMGYLRVGYARSDMNYFERVILNGRNYLPLPDDSYSLGTTTELGSMRSQSMPRGIDRDGKSKSEIDDLKKSNKHLNGIFLYSDWNYHLTVGNNFTEVIQKNFVHYVGGHSRQLYMQGEGKWTYFGEANSLRTATGLQSFAGVVWQYAASNARSLTVKSEIDINYSMAAKFTVTADAKIDVTNAVRFGVSNGLDLKVTGYQAAAECDVAGNFQIKTPLGGRTSSETNFDKTVSNRIRLSVNSGVSTAWTAPVAVAANAAALAGIGATSAGWIERFKGDKSFFRDATPENLEKAYLAAFDIGVPSAMASLGAVVSATILAASIKQKVATALAPVMPKVEVDEVGVTLSAGPDSSLRLTEAGLEINAPLLAIQSQTAEFAADATLNITSAAIEVEADTFSLTGVLIVDGAVDVTSELNVNGVITANLVEAGA